MFFSLRGQGGFQEEGGTIRHIPNGSALDRMLAMYFKVSSNSYKKVTNLLLGMNIYIYIYIQIFPVDKSNKKMNGTLVEEKF